MAKIVYILLDLEAEVKDAVLGVYSDYKEAEKAEEKYHDLRHPYENATKIIGEEIN